MATAESRPKVAFREFEVNRQKFTDEQLRPYEGKWAAFSLDGTRIVAADTDLAKLADLVAAAGEHISNVELEFIDLSDEIFIGGSETI